MSKHPAPPKSAAVTAELVKPEPKFQRLEISSAGKIPIVGILQSLADQMNADFDEYEKHEKAAMMRAMRIGLIMIRAKQLIGHGAYGHWLNKNLKEVRKSQAYRFRALAEAWIERQQLQPREALLLAEPETPPAERERVEQMLFDFVGGRSQAELFRDCGIVVRDPKPRGGANHMHAFLREAFPDHPEYLEMTAAQLPQEVRDAWTAHMREALKNDDTPQFLAGLAWQDLAQKLRYEGLEKKSWGLLPRRQMEEVYGLLIDLKRAMQPAMKP